MKRPLLQTAVLLCTLALPACGGGASGGTATPPARFTSQKLSITFRSVTPATGTPVTVSFNGNIIARSALDTSRHATLQFPAVGGGTRVQVTAATLRPTVVLAQSTSGTIAEVTEQTNGTLTVKATNDVNESGTVNDNDGENQENDVEDQSGQVIGSGTP
ncbi:MAG: hypothetical protein NVS1B6_17330 [Steroidobacteraceae bacterium]